MPTNFHLAPPAKMVDGILAVPIDIQSIDAVFVFDGASETASADATIAYTVGPAAGNPFFDLRQEISQAWLDGASFSIDRLSHHLFGSEPFTDLRVIESVQTAGSVHTLRVQYPLALPNAQLGGSYIPALAWSAGPKLTFVFGLSDLNRARYAEAWLPANLIFDQYSIHLDLQITNTMAPHSVITNGAVANPGFNHWEIDFPERFTALSPLLEIRASDTLTRRTDTTLLPVSGKTVSIDVFKPVGSSVNLVNQTNIINSLLTENEINYGPYLHGERFVAFFNGGGGMEYEGGTTTSTGALAHETFHSWFARGIKPASQADGWWDEGFTSYHDDGADDAVPFDYSDTPIVLCSRDPWQRRTPGNSYGDGSAFWKGMAGLLGAPDLNNLMKALYEKHNGQPVSTQFIEEFLLSNSGNPQIVDAFHRFVYGLEDPSPAPDLWMKDAPGHGGADEWGGTFWDSPDLWIRNHDDDGTQHQSPEYGQDNWFYARVRNNSAAGQARHFVVTFHSKGFAGTQFIYPNDFLPCIAAKAAFELSPNETRILKARWPRAMVPPAGSHTCLLASVIGRSDHPVANRHVWQNNNLSQKNLTVVDLRPNTFMIVPVVISNWLAQYGSKFKLELWKPKNAGKTSISLIHSSKDFFAQAKPAPKAFKVRDFHHPMPIQLDCGGYLRASGRQTKKNIMTSDTPESIQRRFASAWEAPFPKTRRTGIPVDIAPFSQKTVGLKIALASDAKAGQRMKFHLVQRCRKTRQIVGGVAVQITVKKSNGAPRK